MSTGSSEQRSSPAAIYIVAGVLVLCAAVGVPWLRAERSSFAREAEALRVARASAAARLDSLQQEQAIVQASLSLERARAAARAEPKLHLVIAVDSGTLALVRDGITLRTMPARFRGAAPSRGTQTITKIAESPVSGVAPTVDSLGNPVAVKAPETKVDRVTLSDGTVIEGGDAAAVLLGGVEVAPGLRMILVSQRDFAAVRPNLIRGMKAVSF